MGRNDARSQVGEPVVTPLPPAVVTVKAEAKAPRTWDMLPDAEKNAIRAKEAEEDAKGFRLETCSWALPPDAQVPSLGDLAARALAAGAAMAREYATAAGELCKSADTNPSARASARRLLRLALAHLET